MDKITLRKVQLAQLEIAKEFKRICKENDIKYFMDFGTLLGAVRHNGFIPWDDDMDFGMLREEYEKFIKIAPEKLRDDFLLQTWDSDQFYPFPYAKIRKKGTIYVEAVSQNTKAHNELYIDIFPYDVFPMSNKELKNRMIKTKLLYNTLLMQVGMMPWKRHKSIIKKSLSFCKYIPYKIVSIFVDRESLKRKYIHTMTKYNNEKPDLIYGHYVSTSSKYLIPSRCFETFIELNFEGETFASPRDYDCYLKTLYGDYMELPPEEQRENRHCIIEVKI